MLKATVVIVFFILFTSPMYAVCTGCEFASTYGTVTKGYEDAASDIKDRFDELEKTFSKKWEKDILPLLETVRDLEKEITVTMGQLEMMQRIRLLTESEIKELVREIKMIDETLDFTREAHSKKGFKK